MNNYKTKTSNSQQENQKKPDNLGFLNKITNWLEHSAKNSPIKNAVLNALCNAANIHSKIFYSQTTIGKKANACRVYTNEVIAELYQENFIDKQFRDYDTCLYQIHPLLFQFEVRQALKKFLPALGLFPLAYITAQQYNNSCQVRQTTPYNSSENSYLYNKHTTIYRRQHTSRLTTECRLIRTTSACARGEKNTMSNKEFRNIGIPGLTVDEKIQLSAYPDVVIKYLEKEYQKQKGSITHVGKWCLKVGGLRCSFLGIQPDWEKVKERKEVVVSDNFQRKEWTANEIRRHEIKLPHFVRENPELYKDQYHDGYSQRSKTWEEAMKEKGLSCGEPEFSKEYLQKMKEFIRNLPMNVKKELLNKTKNKQNYMYQLIMEDQVVSMWDADDWLESTHLISREILEQAASKPQSSLLSNSSNKQTTTKESNIISQNYQTSLESSKVDNVPDQDILKNKPRSLIPNEIEAENVYDADIWEEVF